MDGCEAYGISRLTRGPDYLCSPAPPALCAAFLLFFAHNASSRCVHWLLLPLQARWEAREPREQDVMRIAQLEAGLQEREAGLHAAAKQLAQLRGEMLLREENYNKHFR